METTGRDGASVAALPLHGSPSTSRQESETKAQKAVLRMFRVLPPPRVEDPEAFLALAIALFAGFPPDVMDEASLVIPVRHKNPQLADMREVLLEIYEPIARRHRDQRLREAREPVRPPRTAEEQQAVDAQVARWRAKVGPVPEKRRGWTASSIPGVSRVQQWLAERRQGANRNGASDA